MSFLRELHTHRRATFALWATILISGSVGLAIASTYLLVLPGLLLVSAGEKSGWQIVGVGGLCLLVLLLAWRPKCGPLTRILLQRAYAVRDAGRAQVPEQEN